MSAEKLEVVSGGPAEGGLMNSPSLEHYGSRREKNAANTDSSLSAQYSWLLKTAIALWVLIVATCAVGFVAGRYSVQLRVEVMPADVNIAAPNINVAMPKPATVEVTVPTPSVNVENTIPAPVVNIDNKIPPSTVNVLVDGRTTKVERIEQKPMAPPVYKERDPEGELLPPPKNLVK